SGAWLGVLPLVRVKSRVVGHYLVSMPFLNAGGPLGVQAAQVALVEHAVAEAKRTGVDLLELRSRTPVPGGLRVSHRKITVHLELPPTSEELWAAFPGKLRSQIRRPQKEGFTVRFGPDQTDSFYSVFTRNMRALGTPVLPRLLFERVAAVFPAFVEFGVVYRGAEPIAAGCGFAWQGEFELVWASSLREYSRSAPNMLLYWAFLERTIQRAVPLFDFGRCTPDSGTHAFKRQWGGVDVPLPWAQWSPRNVTSTPSPDRSLFRIAAACWSHLPLAVTNRLGPLLATRLP
ncbi:MAG TPA: GNAT family N-acetyltransferase, partial [Gemmatimonadaceae bacterium]|nr:GNAT family N-acetyltransferase [Gemmatimonadaceae bacterium]